MRRIVDLYTIPSLLLSIILQHLWEIINVAEISVLAGQTLGQNSLNTVQVAKYYGDVILCNLINVCNCAEL